MQHFSHRKVKDYLSFTTSLQYKPVRKRRGPPGAIPVFVYGSYPFGRSSGAVIRRYSCVSVMRMLYSTPSQWNWTGGEKAKSRSVPAWPETERLKMGALMPLFFCNQIYLSDTVEIGLCSRTTAKAKTRSNGSTERSACVAVMIGLAPVCCRK